LIENIMLTTKFNETGGYLVRLCISGEWKITMIDDFLPCDANKNLVYTNAYQNQLLGPLIEKAYAKTRGAYASLSRGFEDEAFRTLTGFPCFWIDLEDKTAKETAWNALHDSGVYKYLMSASTPDDCNLQSRYCLGKNHAYSILQVVHYKKQYQLLLLRNPHGILYQY
jgi:hypothetical protein